MSFALPSIASIALLCAGSAWFAIAGLSETGLPLPEQAPAAYATVDAPATSNGLDEHGRWPRAADGLFYIDAAVNGVPVRFLVDTGASVTVLTKDDAARAGVAPAGAATTIATVAGDTAMHWGSIERVDLGDAEIGDVAAAIVARPGGVSLLGQNVLRRMRTVSIERDLLTLS